MESKREIISDFLTEVLDKDPSLLSGYMRSVNYQNKTKIHLKINICLTISILLGYAFVFMILSETISLSLFYPVYFSFTAVTFGLIISAFLTKSASTNNYLISLSVYLLGICIFVLSLFIRENLLSNNSTLRETAASLNSEEAEFSKEKVQLVVDTIPSLVDNLNIFMQTSYTSVIYCNLAYVVLDEITWSNTLPFVVSNTAQIYISGIRIYSKDFRISYLLQFGSMFMILIIFKYYLHSVIRSLNVRNVRLSKIKHFYHEWLVNLNVSYCLVKEDKVVFSNNKYQESIRESGLEDKLTVQAPFISKTVEGMKIAEMFEIMKRIDTLPFTKVAVLGTEDCQFECSVRKYSSGFLEVFFSDISHALEQERQKIEQKYRNTVFAKIAHEFKTPVTNIVLLVEKIKEKVNDPAVLAELNMMKGLSDYVTFLVTDITSYFHGYSTLKMVPELVKLTEVCEFCFNVLSSMLEVKSSSKKSVTPKLICTSSILLTIDQIRLKQILLNCISNAAKFTTHGCIALKCEETEEDVILSVIDDGIGISPEKLAQLRTRDELKFEVRDEYNKMGSGLGMSISKQICDEMGLKFKIESEQGKGTTVSVTIPKTEFSVQTEMETTVDTVLFHAPYLLTLDSSSPASAVVIAEDNSIIRKSLRALIEKIADSLEKNWTAVEVEDGIFTLNEVVNLNLTGMEVEFLVTDEFMDFLNGSDSIIMLKKLMEDQKIKSFPCFSCSAFEDECFQERILSSGADSLLPKPATRERLIEALKQSKVL